MQISLLYLHPITEKFILTVQSKDIAHFSNFDNGILKRKIDVSFPILINVYNQKKELLYTGIQNSYNSEINLYKPCNSITLKDFSLESITSEHVVCQQFQRTKDCIKLYITNENSDYIPLRKMKIHYNIGIRRDFCFFITNEERKYKKMISSDYSHKNLLSPTNGLINIINIYKNNTKLNIISRDGIINNPLNGIFFAEYTKDNTIELIFKDENYFSKFDKPRFLYNHQDNNEMCINREKLDFYQKRDEPILFYSFILNKYDIKKFNKNAKKNDISIIVKKNTNLVLNISRNIETILTTNKNFKFNIEIIGEVI